MRRREKTVGSMAAALAASAVERARECREAPRRGRRPRDRGDALVEALGELAGRAELPPTCPPMLREAAADVACALDVLPPGAESGGQDKEGVERARLLAAAIASGDAPATLGGVHRLVSCGWPALSRCSEVWMLVAKAAVSAALPSGR